MYDKNQTEKEDPTWMMFMETLKMRTTGLKANETVRKAIKEYYLEKGEPEPDWRQKKPYFDVDGNIIYPE